MATIFPQKFPERINVNPGKQAEIKVYELLKTLPSEYTIFYSVHWESINDWGVKEGEADFIILHPKMGIVILEVKGGEIRYDATTDQWYSHSLGANDYPIKDPMMQGARTHYRIKDKLIELPGWPVGEFNINNAVCFPDTRVTQCNLKPDLPRELVIDHQDLASIETSILNIYQALFGKNLLSREFGEDRTRITTQFLATSFKLKTPLGIAIDYEDQQLIELTEQQYNALALLGDRKRVAIGGCAGSGKTMFALEKARQFSELGMEVLLTCFNAPLAEYLKQRSRNINIYTFHDLCRHYAKLTFQQLTPYINETQFYEQTLPDALLNAADDFGKVYDAIIMDEGQDFKFNYYLALDALLRDNGYLYIFFDNNQNLYRGQLDFGGLIPEQPYLLTQNCRNTQAIHRTVIRFHSNPKQICCTQPRGRHPEIISYQSDRECLQELKNIIYRLVNEDQIKPSDIVVLTPRSQESTLLGAVSSLGRFKISPSTSSSPNIIQATSIYLFKGLEKRVVILFEIDNRIKHNPDNLLYVGCSRARTHLVILHDKNISEDLKNRIATS